MPHREHDDCFNWLPAGPNGPANMRRHPECPRTRPTARTQQFEVRSPNLVKPHRPESMEERWTCDDFRSGPTATSDQLVSKHAPAPPQKRMAGLDFCNKHTLLPPRTDAGRTPGSLKMETERQQKSHLFCPLIKKTGRDEKEQKTVYF